MPKNPLALMLICAAVAVWQIFELATATEAPSRAVELLHYFLLACALLGLVGGAIRYAKEKTQEEGQ